ncbi:MAG: hypothetical protein JXX29_04235 [Deltaproteobacteria bacterium]|nr:hypothetical protein [Deltaproteobacteria bacterium]MBN2670853.1 hypothetical protein [Deltaproteobacteria bacterium]
MWMFLFAIGIGGLILAPGIIRTFKKKPNSSNGCGDCAGCCNAGKEPKPEVQIVTLKRK